MDELEEEFDGVGRDPGRQIQVRLTARDNLLRRETPFPKSKAVVRNKLWAKLR